MKGIRRASWIAMMMAPGVLLAQSNFSVYQPTGVAATPTMLLVATPFCNPGSQIIPAVNLPRQILRFDPSGGTPTVFSDLSKLPNSDLVCSADGQTGFDGVLAIAPGTGGFTPGAVFVLLNTQVYIVPPTGGTPILFATLPQQTHGMAFDTVGKFGYNLVVVTRVGNSTSSSLYTVTSKGMVSSAIATINTVAESPAIAPANYGIITQGDAVLAGNNGTLYDVTPTGTVNVFATGFNWPTGVNFIPPKPFCTFYEAILGPYTIDKENQLNPNPSVVQTLPQSFFAGHAGQMLVRDEYSTSGSATNIYAVDSTGHAVVIGTATGEQEQAVFVTSCVSLTCPANAGQVGVAYSSALLPGGGTPPYTFSITSGAIPPGLSLNANTGTITGTPITPGTFSFTAQVQDSTGTSTGTTTINCTITIAPMPLAIACPGKSGQVGVAYSSSLIAMGGYTPYTFSISAGSLPPGLTLNPSTGAITGTPTTPGTYTFGGKVTDNSGKSVAVKCSITIAAMKLACPATAGEVTMPYQSSLVPTGGFPPYTFSITSGALPTGLTLNTSTGAITGTPTKAGSYSFTAQVVDSTGTAAGTATAKCAINVAPAALALACPPAKTGQLGRAYASGFKATGGVAPYTFSITSGALPPGLILNTSTGAITGTPTNYGVFSFSGTVTDSTKKTVTVKCGIAIAPATLTLTCPSGGAVNTPYQSSLMASGGVPPYTFSITSGSLPPGLTLNTSTGAITGTPTTAGTYAFTATVNDSNKKTATANCSITIAQVNVVCPTNSGQVGVPYSSPVSASGGVAPYTFAIIAGALPPGLTLQQGGGVTDRPTGRGNRTRSVKVESSTGSGWTISGTPTTYGTYTFTLQAVDSTGTAAGTGSSTCTIVIAPPPLTLACPNAGQVNSAYNSGVVASGGVPPYKYSIASGSLPPGLSFNASTGALTGTPTTAGTYSVVFKVVDSSGMPAGTVTNTCSITITPPNVLGTCVPTSSLSVLVQGSVATAYIPNGSWSESGLGVDLVPIEGAAPPRAFIQTPQPINSCSSNWVTGETVCTGNGTDVYLINGSTLTNTLNSSGFGSSYFSGGSCTNCGVAIDAATNQAWIETSAGQGIGGLQPLDLGTNTFGTLTSVPELTSENIAVNPILNLVLSPNEGYNTPTFTADYQLFQFSPTSQLFSLANASQYFGSEYADELDSAGLDCTTNIALATDEFTGYMFISDLSQISFDSAAGTWTAPSQKQNLPEFNNFAAGTSGMAVAPGSHLGIVVGEFCCGGQFGVIQLPSNSGAGIPAIVDWVAVNIPNDPNNVPWQNGLDPHTVTAYVSPNTGKALGLMVNDERSYIALVDLQGLLSAPRVSGSHNIDPGVDLVATGLLTWISIPAPFVSCPTAGWDANNYYSSTLSTLGLTPPITFGITGSLPPGLALDPATGIISGTPGTLGSYSFTVQATDSTSAMITNSCSISINAAPSLSCPSAAGVAGVPYSSSAAITGGTAPFSFSLSSGALPPGLSFNSSTGSITGTPTLAGVYNFTVSVTDAQGATASTSNCGITIAPPPLTVVAPASTGQVTIAYISQVATGGAAPYTMAVTSGSLPPGLNANSTGTLTGTPTATGTYSFTLQATDSASSVASVNATITIGALQPGVLASCQPAGSMSVLAQRIPGSTLSSVNAYIANGSWQESYPGVQLVPLEGGGTLSTISTPDTVNSCAANWVTGQVVCTGNYNEVYLINGSTVSNSLFAGGFGYEYFSGGNCTTCGVTIDAATNQAYIEIASGYGTGGVQSLDLSSNTFGTLLLLPGESAESIGMDPYRHWLLSPNQGIYGPPDYAIVSTQPSLSLFDFASIGNYYGYYDYLGGGAEDCSTGISVATQEGSANLFIADLTQSTFDPVAHQWNGPAQVQYMPELYQLSDGPSGIAIAGASHLGIVSGAFCCGNGFAAIQLPSTSGSGTPAVADWVVAYYPNDPSGMYWQNSVDPARVSAYVSPNSRKAIGLVGNDSRSYLASLDLQALLSAPRQSGTHYIDPSVDLVGSGILKWIAASKPTMYCPSPNEWVTGTAYSATVNASGGFPPYTFSLIVGSLPNGLMIDNSGNITGTPSVTGNFNFTAQAVDSTGTAGGTASISCGINIAAPLALTAPAATGQAGTPYSSAIGISGGFPPYNLYVSSGNFPPGLTLNYTGTITGTPTTAGTYNFSVYVYDSSYTSVGNITGNFTITIAPPPLLTSCPSNGALTTVQYFSQIATGGVPPFKITITSGALPPGLIANTNGVINGVPTGSGAYSFGIQVNDSGGGSASVGGCGITVAAPQPAVLASCQAASSLSVLVQGSNATAYFPAGSWNEYNNNIYVVPLEGSGALATISTPTPVNSCASNWVTGETVCSDNYGAVYTLSGSSLVGTLTSSAFGYNYSSDGYCTGCGVAMDSGANKAMISLAQGYGYPGGVQFLDLASNNFEKPISFNATVPEGALVDPIRHMVLAPTEGYGYFINQTASPAGTFNFSNYSSLAYYNESAAEECTTGIALSTNEYYGTIFVADLSQGVFDPIAGMWNAPSQSQYLPELAYNLTNGPNGVAIAQGTHLGVVTGEFCCGAGFGVIQLPSSSGSGTPAIVDWVEANFPNDPSNASWVNGEEPHTVTAYVSPNTGKALAVIGNDSRTYIALIDMQALLSAPRQPGTHYLASSVDLVATGILQWIAVQ